ncbi:snrnp core protein family member [Anaeramoeba flamelloides]|uniref:Snrnp core protein family member n=1 Tax=Anaeramoeba flamelloides TaxID=1746091 RepID=A0AAV7ZMX2_9EUKA|nr:snrnp core protein family member [Anaeramoeba flamelloides]
MIFYQLFKKLVGKVITVELKNDLIITGLLEKVDQYINLQFTNLKLFEPENHPQFASTESCFIRGKSIRYVFLPENMIDNELIQESTKEYHEKRKQN